MLKLGLLLSLAVLGQALGVDYSNPKSQVEYINQQTADKPLVVLMTRPPLINLTPPPPPANSVQYKFDPNTLTWTRVAGDERETEEGALIWNQSNDKWLTNVPHP